MIGISMDALPLQFHHLGLAVRRPEKAIRFLKALGYDIGAAVFDPQQNVNLRLCQSDLMPDVEIIYPALENGPLESILENHSEMIYHLCYQTRSLTALLKAFRQCGIRIGTVLPPKPAVLFGGRFVSFHTVPGFGLIEILESPVKESTSVDPA